MLRGLKQRFPTVHLKAFTMVEIAYLARRTKVSIRETLERLRGRERHPGLHPHHRGFCPLFCSSSKRACNATTMEYPWEAP
jgi:hypothetical protein